MTIKGIDISHYQDSPDFSLIKQNADFVIIKATEGTSFTDPQFLRNQAESRRAALLLGYYHFAKVTNAIAEADYFTSVVHPNMGEILCLDFEVSYVNPPEWCKTFLDRVSSNLNGYKPLLYLNKSLINNYNWSAVFGANYGLWVASYDGSTTSLPSTPWPNVALKQYSSMGRVPGITGNVDMDTFFGDAPTFLKYGVQQGGSMPGTITVNQDDWNKLLANSTTLDSVTDLLGVPRNSQFGVINDAVTKAEQDAHDRGFNEGKASVPPAPPVPTPSTPPQELEVNGQKWVLNGLSWDAGIIQGNYKLEQ